MEEAIRQFTKSYEIIIAEDGSNDGSDSITLELTRENPRIFSLHSEERLGKGRALKRAFKTHPSEIVIFSDIDLAMSLKHLSELIALIEKGCDGAIGSRYINGAHVARPLSRTLTSRLYNLIVRYLFRDEIDDHQCGFKAFNYRALESVINDVESDGFLFDTELLIKARWKGLQIVQVPVMWREPQGRKSSIQLLRDGIKMGIGLVKLRVKSLNRQVRSRGEAY